MLALPKIMVAPNGARRKKIDHPQIPVTIDEIVDVAVRCYAAGADGLHAHVRDADQEHVLDAGLYSELLRELAVKAPSMQVQITTEAVGKYSPAQQRALVKKVCPKAVSVSLAEMTLELENEQSEVRAFYHDHAAADIAVQHILYDAEQVRTFFHLVDKGFIPEGAHQLLFVLGRYAKNQESMPSDLAPFLDVIAAHEDQPVDWAACAFGKGETDCLLAAHHAGGKIRVGFENSLWHANGDIAQSNVERVRNIIERISATTQNFG